MLILVLLSWLPYVVNAWSPRPLPSMIAGWGGTDKGCEAVILTDPIIQYKSNYRLFVACRIANPSVDVMQDDRIATSRPFTITGGLLDVSVDYAPSSPIAALAKAGTRTDFTLFLMPKDKDASTIRKLADIESQGGALLLPGAILHLK